MLGVAPTFVQNFSGPLSFFLPDLTLGGAERVWVNFASGLAARGHAVELVVGGSASGYLSELHRDVKLVRLPPVRLSLLAVPLSNYLRRVRPKALLATMVGANLVASVAWRLAGAKSKLIFREACAPASASSTWRERLDPTLRWLCYRYADAIIAPAAEVSQQLKERLPASSHPRIRVIPNPIEIERILELAAKPKPLVMQGELACVVGCGRLSPKKAFEVLLEAFALVLKQKPARLVILGEGSELEALERLTNRLGISASVVFAGVVENPFCYFAHAQVFVLSSRSEGFPNVLLQALACGANVVSTNCETGPSEILTTREQGLLVPVADPRAMADAILHQLSAPPKNPAAALRARDFEASKAILPLEQLIAELG